MIGLDTNVLARYYVASNDAPSQHQSAAAKKLLESGKPLFVSKSVVLELEWELRGYYKSQPKDVLIVLEHLLEMPHVEVEDRVAVELAVAALRDGFDFGDALHHASARHCTSMATFDDKRFARRATKKGWKPPVKLVAS
ncbi:type II toxin-antitoxin system VapC family toxin [Hydrogenophaga taeniospiralis]|uniref:type II toxin-antitoxin system VapC family toxin n=1 Tax=Hydrogenophaga taeniospiralis TaxID=65656 RepID=UPI001CFC02AB|nr:type II toxin-antitoxin system VapC family toxin [Hydrogenophaga taeniospiralis]UCU92071.1 type II toxin-antitoxin system VapC family toxin [Hydrogenophaga taeniospiralis]